MFCCKERGPITSIRRCARCDFIVAARGSDGLALYRVPANASGLSIKDELRADGTYAGNLTLEDVKAGLTIGRHRRDGRGRAAPRDGRCHHHDLRRTVRLHGAGVRYHARLSEDARAVRQSRSAASRRCSSARSICTSRRSWRSARWPMPFAPSTIRRRRRSAQHGGEPREVALRRRRPHDRPRGGQAARRDRLHRRIRRRTLSAPRHDAERLARQSVRASPPLRRCCRPPAACITATRAGERAVLGRVPVGRQSRRGLEFVQRRGIPRRHSRLLRKELSARI